MGLFRTAAFQEGLSSEDLVRSRRYGERVVLSGAVHGLAMEFASHVAPRSSTQMVERLHERDESCQGVPHVVLPTLVGYEVSESTVRIRLVFVAKPLARGYKAHKIQVVLQNSVLQPRVPCSLDFSEVHNSSCTVLLANLLL